MFKNISENTAPLPSQLLSILNSSKVKVKIFLFQAMEAHRVARGSGSHIT
jgi:hypothetical protein